MGYCWSTSLVQVCMQAWRCTAICLDGKGACPKSPAGPNEGMKAAALKLPDLFCIDLVLACASNRSMHGCGRKAGRISALTERGMQGHLSIHSACCTSSPQLQLQHKQSGAVHIAIA